MGGGLFLYLIGAILILSFGLGKKVPNQRKTKGIITDITHVHTSGKGKPVYRATVAYSINGKTYEIESGYYSSDYHIGKKIVVLYNEMDPQEGIVRPNMRIVLFAGLLFLAGTYVIIKEFLKI
ncbi:MAG: DUF3592 domain-containing protein [Clostridiales bacterium]|nr:DUF3592 domain-containing protein [Clostridiales bacterium]